MALTRIVGDIHGNFNEYSFYTLGVGRTRHAGDPVPPDRSIQVGDFGIGFYTPYWHESVNDWMKKNPGHRFIRGNHDDPNMCKTMAGYIEDGYCENDVMFVGGAWSIDFAWRTPMVDWWPGEEVSSQRFEEIIEQYVQLKPRVMITHDCPTSVAWEMFLSKGLGLGDNRQIKTRTGEALQAMFEIHQPELWVFGHWHNTRRQEINGTTFQCLGELDFIDVDL
jgi:hypothetical protein